MPFILAALAVLFLVLGLERFALGGLPTVIGCLLAGAALLSAWKARSIRHHRREDHL